MPFDSNLWERHKDFHFIDKKVKSQKGTCYGSWGYKMVQSGIISRILYSKIRTLPQHQVCLLGSQSIKIVFFLRKNNVLLKNAISFLVVQSHAEATQSYAPVNMKGFFCPPSFSNQMASAQMASYHRASHGKHSPMELFFNKYTTLVLINFIKLLISFQIQCY